MKRRIYYCVPQRRRSYLCGHKEDHITEDPKQNPFNEKPKEDPITVKPKDNAINGDPQELQEPQ